MSLHSKLTPAILFAMSCSSSEYQLDLETSPAIEVPEEPPFEPDLFEGEGLPDVFDLCRNLLSSAAGQAMTDEYGYPLPESVMAIDRGGMFMNTAWKQVTQEYLQIHPEDKGKWTGLFGNLYEGKDGSAVAPGHQELLIEEEYLSFVIKGQRVYETEVPVLHCIATSEYVPDRADLSLHIHFSGAIDHNTEVKIAYVLGDSVEVGGELYSCENSPCGSVVTSANRMIEEVRTGVKAVVGKDPGEAYEYFQE